MRRSRVLLVAVEAIVVLVLLPVTINVATGGSTPPGLALLKPLAWYVVAVLSTIAVGMPVWQFVSESRVPSALRYSRYHRATQRRRVLDGLTERVSDELAKALENIPWLKPSLAFAVDVVMPSSDILPADPGEPGPGDIRQVFELFDRNLLVLGNPGAGKSTLLLELARHLLAEAVESDSPVPVLLRLAHWRAVPDSGQRQWPWQRWSIHRADAAYFSQWCASEMQRNGIPRSLAAAWLGEDDSVILLLDGLDEMPEQERRGFITALDEVQRQRGPLALAVTCRTADYARVRPPLGVQGAVEIEPLDRPRIEALLARHDVKLADLREVLRADDALWDLVDSPLLLALLAAQLRTDDLPVLAADRNTNRSRLLEGYINVALASRPFRARKPVRLATLRQWLGTVARAATPSGLLHWSKALTTAESHTLANGISPGLILGGACGLLLGDLLLIISPAPAIIGMTVLIMTLGGRAVHLLRSDTQGTRRRAPVRAVVTGLASGLFMGGLAAASLKALSAIRLPSSAIWWIEGPFLIISVNSLIYQAIRVDQKAHPEKIAETDRLHREAAARTNNPKYRLRQESFSRPEDRAAWVAIPNGGLISFVVLWLLVNGRSAAAVAFGIAAGAVLGGSQSASRSIAGLPRSHPTASLAQMLRPRVVLVVVHLLYIGLFADMCSGGQIHRWLMPIAHNATGPSRWPFDLIGVFLGFLGGQIVAHWLFTWDRISISLADVTARAWLTSEHRLPWRVRRYVAFVTGIGIVRGRHGHHFFRHDLLAEHCRGPEVTATE